MTVQDDLLLHAERLSSKLETLEPGSEEYTTVFNQLTKIDELLFGMEKAYMEHSRKENELAEAKRDRQTKATIDISTTIAKMLFYGGITFVLMYWEEDNTCTGVFKTWASKLAPSKLF